MCIVGNYWRDGKTLDKIEDLYEEDFLWEREKI